MRGKKSLSRAVSLSRVQQPPKGMHPTRFWAEREGLSEPRMRALLPKLIRMRKMRKQSYRILVGDVVIPVPHYGLV